jgi:hypothetical protein
VFVRQASVLKCREASAPQRLADAGDARRGTTGELVEAMAQANVGVKCGRDSDLTVLDVDGDAGRETLRDLEMEHGELPETPIAITGSGGAHFSLQV